ncbi:hypothetical protein [Streptomyces sp. ISL-10]|uniref:hypothetical protein n=1 Tax=Streptomyces sp. ISL-10 TaxID=2819172 RepID=UPI0027E52BC6|nr:hypothetical protein [Streptomyces sp. ISL-10]
MLDEVAEHPVLGGEELRGAVGGLARADDGRGADHALQRPQVRERFGASRERADRIVGVLLGPGGRGDRHGGEGRQEQQQMP